MRYPVTGEKATRLTAQMVDALQALQDAIPNPSQVPNLATAKALLHRGFIENFEQGVPPRSNSVYWLTHSGSTALRIERIQRAREGAA